MKVTDTNEGLTVLLFLVKVQSRHVVAPDVEHGLDGGVVHELHEGPWGWIGGEIWGGEGV